MVVRPRKKRRTNANRAVAIVDDADDLEEVEEVVQSGEIVNEAGEVGDAAPGEGHGTEDDSPTEEQIEEWEAFREEYYEIVNELPVSLHRSYTLMHELDEQVEGHLALQLPAIKEYIAFRHALLKPPSPPPPPEPIDALMEPATEPSTSVPLPERPVSSSGTSTATMDHIAQHPESPHLNGVTETPNPKKRKRSSGDESSPPRRSPRGASQSTNLSRVSSRSSQSSSLVPITPDAKNVNGIISPLNGAVSNGSTSMKGVLSRVSEKPVEPEPLKVVTKRMLARIAKLAEESLRASDEKIGIAQAMYDLVDRHVRSLDAKIKEYEASVAIGLRPGTHPLDGTLTFEPSEEPEYADPRRGRKRDRKGKQRAGTEAISESLPEVLVNMPVIETEPTYCYCHRVSFGEMIGCDGEDCPFGGWFHMECLGMTAPPKGSWYCRECAKEKNNPKKKKARV